MKFWNLCHRVRGSVLKRLKIEEISFQSLRELDPPYYLVALEPWSRMQRIWKNSRFLRKMRYIKSDTTISLLFVFNSSFLEALKAVKLGQLCESS
jgi:hypothetical protein